MKTVTIVGAGLVGSMWAVYLSKAGYKVSIFERRPDIRKADIAAGKSINLALSDRGWKAFDAIGVSEDIKKMAIPMSGRIMHSLEGELTYQPYGQEGQAIYSVSRGGINAAMMNFAEQNGAALFYEEECTNVHLEKGIAFFKNTQTGETTKVESDLVFGADGAFSAVRYNAMQKLDRFNFSQNYIEDGYREILLPANEDGSYKLDKNGLHIWPRSRFMLIALANEDGSFTCTLFMPFENHEYAFDKLTSKEKVNSFFKTIFPDFYEMMPNIADTWEDHPLSSLAIVRCYPWTHGKTALIGDAAHATVPFYGQGMNCGFEDCSSLWELFEKHGDDWDTIFKEYEIARKPNGDAVQDLSLHNYHVMRDFVGDEDFLLRKSLERKIQKNHPDKYIPLYSMVTFSDIPYSKALEIGKKQEQLFDEIMAMDNIKSNWDSQKVEDRVIELLETKYSDCLLSSVRH